MPLRSARAIPSQRLQRITQPPRFRMNPRDPVIHNQLLGACIDVRRFPADRAVQNGQRFLILSERAWQISKVRRLDIALNVAKPTIRPGELLLCTRIMPDGFDEIVEIVEARLNDHLARLCRARKITHGIVDVEDKLGSERPDVRHAGVGEAGLVQRHGQPHHQSRNHGRGGHCRSPVATHERTGAIAERMPPGPDRLVVEVPAQVVCELRGRLVSARGLDIRELARGCCPRRRRAAARGAGL